MDKEEFLKTTSRIICNEGGGSLANRVLEALKAEMGEPLAATINESNFGQQCEVAIAGHNGVFGYCYRNEDGSLSNRTPEDFAQVVAKRIMSNAQHDRSTAASSPGVRVMTLLGRILGVTSEARTTR